MKTTINKLLYISISTLALAYISPIQAKLYLYQQNNGSTLISDQLKLGTGNKLKKIHSSKYAKKARTTPITSIKQQSSAFANRIGSTANTSVIKQSFLSQIGNNSVGNNAISAPVLGKTLIIRSCDHDAGAICSIRWNNKEFINDYDHGRQLQSASSFDGLGESFNPTEAGGSAVYYGINPSDGKSILLARKIEGNVLSTYSQMAFWNPVNGVQTSNHTLNKRVTIGYAGIDNVIEYLTQFNIPANEKHSYGVFEAVTAYMPRDFSTFWVYNPKTKNVQRLPPSTYADMKEQNLPIIASTADQRFALGVFSPDTPQRNYPNIGYGAFLLDGNPKWNNVFRVHNPKGSIRFRSYVVIGSLEDVRRSMELLHSKF